MIMMIGMGRKWLSCPIARNLSKKKKEQHLDYGMSLCHRINIENTILWSCLVNIYFKDLIE